MSDNKHHMWLVRDRLHFIKSVESPFPILANEAASLVAKLFDDDKQEVSANRDQSQRYVDVLDGDVWRPFSAHCHVVPQYAAFGIQEKA